MTVTPKEKALNEKEQVCKAEAIQALHIIDANIPFASAETDGERFRWQFPDSRIAQEYKQGRTKVNYVVQQGIAPLLASEVKKSYAGKPFSFKFDETTTSQVKKQYDAYITYYSEERKRTQTSYCGSAENLKEHFLHFIEELNLEVEWFLTFGMDGPSVNQAFENSTRKDLENKGVRFLDTGTCTLHICNNSFASGLKMLKEELDLDQFAMERSYF